MTGVIVAALAIALLLRIVLLLLPNTDYLEEVSVPVALANSGLSSEVATNRLYEAIVAARQRAATRRLPIFISELQDLQTVVIPQAGISLGNLVAMMQSLLPRYLRNGMISGEFTIFGTQLSLQLRLDGELLFSDSVTFSDPTVDSAAPDFLLQEAAFRLIEERFTKVLVSSYQCAPVTAGPNANAPRSKSRCAELHVGLGYLYQDHGYIQAAKEQFQEAQALDPHNADAEVALGFVARHFGRWSEAGSDFEKAAHDNSANADAYVGLGYVYLASRKPRRVGVDAATAEFEHALEVSDHDADAYVGLAQIDRIRSAPDRAIAELYEAMGLRPTAADPHVVLAAIWRSEHDLSDAIAEYREAIQLSPIYADAHGGLGAVLLEAHRVDEALAELQMAIWLSPNDYRLHVELGSGLLEKGRLDEALGQFRDALLLNHVGAPHEVCKAVGNEARASLSAADFALLMQKLDGMHQLLQEQALPQPSGETLCRRKPKISH